jgi:hypothetical protein
MPRSIAREMCEPSLWFSCAAPWFTGRTKKGFAYIVKRLHCWVADMLSTFRTTLSMVGGFGCRDFCIPSRGHDVLARPGKVICALRRRSSRLAMYENLIGQLIGREIRGIGSQKLFSFNDGFGSQGYHRTVDWTGPPRSSRSRRCNSSSFGSQVAWCGHVPTAGIRRPPPFVTLIMVDGGGHRCGGPSESRRPVRCRARFTRPARY